MTFLLVDVLYLCHRAWFTTGRVQFSDQNTGVAHGVLTTLEQMHDLFNPVATLLAIDGRHLFREDIFPEYKGHRRKAELSDQEKRDQEEMFRQVNELQSWIFEELGYLNVEQENGFEADDLIAKVAASLDGNMRGIIISADEDLFQCIRPNVYFQKPGKPIITYDSFMKDKGVSPDDWAVVKAIAGCSSDGVPGVPGVGNKTAAKYLRGELKTTSKKYNDIAHAGDLVNRNIRLTRLPYEGCPLIPLVQDQLTPARRSAVYKKLGFASPRAKAGERKGLI